MTEKLILQLQELAESLSQQDRDRLIELIEHTRALAKLCATGMEMRITQKRYFKNRNQADLLRSRELETLYDSLTREIVQKYTESQNTPQQGVLFT